MNEYAIDENHDMYIVNGQIARRTSTEGVLQLIKTRLLTVQEEWFMDLNAGLPWYTEMLGKPVDLYKVRSYISSEIVQTNGVNELLSLELLYNNTDRKLDVEFTYSDIYGNIIEGSI